MEDSKKYEIYSMVNDRIVADMSTIRDRNGRVYIFGLNIKLLDSLADFMRLVICTKMLPFHVVSRKNPIPMEPMAGYMHLLGQFQALVFHDVALSPDLDLFQNEFRKNQLCSLMKGPSSMGRREWAECCNEFVQEMRREGRRIGIKTKMKDWRNGSNKNSKRLTRYLDALFDRYARLMIVRLDFYYHVGTCRDEEQADEWQMVVKTQDRKAQDAYGEVADVSADHPNFQEDQIPRVDILTVTKDWSRFMDNTRGKTSLFEHKVGHVAAIECSRVGGHHIHAAFFFDGSEVHRDQYMADEIGKYWVQLTGGRGYYHNCNRRSYRRRSVGRYGRA